MSVIPPTVSLSAVGMSKMALSPFCDSDTLVTFSFISGPRRVSRIRYTKPTTEHTCRKFCIERNKKTNLTFYQYHLHPFPRFDLPFVLKPERLVTMTVVFFSAPVSRERWQVLMPLSAASAVASASRAPSDSINASAESRNTSRAAGVISCAMTKEYCDEGWRRLSTNEFKIAWEGNNCRYK